MENLKKSDDYVSDSEEYVIVDIIEKNIGCGPDVYEKDGIVDFGTPLIDSIEDSKEYKCIEDQLMAKVYREFVLSKLDFFSLVVGDEERYRPFSNREIVEIKELLDVDLEAARERVGYEMGDCHLLWSIKKRILMDDYSIDWKSPAELNPGMIFD